MLTPALCIKNLRRVLLIHHFLTDVLKCPVVPDQTLMKWGAELKYNQYQFCLSSREVTEYYDMFKGWDPHNKTCIDALEYDDDTRDRAIQIYRAYMELKD